MRGLMRGWGVGLAAIIVVAACGDDPKASSASQGMLEIAQAQCGYFSRCQPDNFALKYATVDDCAFVVARVAGATLQLPGVIATDAQLRACATAIDGSACDALGYGAPACRLTGTLADGAACLLANADTSVQCWGDLCASDDSGNANPATSLQCASGFCEASVEGACGRCAPRAPAGGRCSLPGFGPCATGLACDQRSGTCAPPIAKDQPCDGETCALGLKCVEAKCIDPLPVGGACTTYECATGLACSDDGKCVESSDKGTTVVTAGQACVALQFMHASTTVCKQSSCVTGGTCVPNAGVGQRCNLPEGVDGTLPYCDVGLACIPSAANDGTGTCAPIAVSTCN